MHCQDCFHKNVLSIWLDLQALTFSGQTVQLLHKNITCAFSQVLQFLLTVRRSLKIEQRVDDGFTL